MSNVSTATPFPPYQEEESRDAINSRHRKYYKDKSGVLLKARRLSNKIEFIKRLGGSCQECGYNKHHAALEFDHLDPSSKKFEPGKVLDWKDREEAWSEISKCRLLCSNCHRIHSFEAGHYGSQKSYNRTKTFNKICSRCNTGFSAKTSIAKFCGSKCKDLSNR